MTTSRIRPTLTPILRSLCLSIAAIGVTIATGWSSAARADNTGVLTGHGASRIPYNGRHDSDDLRMLRRDLGALARDSRNLLDSLSNQFRYGSVGRESRRSIERFVRQAHDALDAADSRNPSVRTIEKEVAQLDFAADDVARALYDDRRISRQLAREWDRLHERTDEIRREAGRLYDHDRGYGYSHGPYVGTGSGHVYGGYWNGPRPRDPHDGRWRNNGSYYDNNYRPSPPRSTSRTQSQTPLISPTSPGVSTSEWMKHPQN